jgi:hypothetical protein
MTSLLLVVFGFPIVSVVALASAPKWLVDFFERLGIVEDCNDHPRNCGCEMCRWHPEFRRPKKGKR